MRQKRSREGLEASTSQASTSLETDSSSSADEFTEDEYKKKKAHPHTPAPVSITEDEGSPICCSTCQNEHHVSQTNISFG